ncbi:hypothetical protein NT06LI_1410a, partial [Listeria innocua FSL J1-023]
RVTFFSMKYLTWQHPFPNLNTDAVIFYVIKYAILIKTKKEG